MPSHDKSALSAEYLFWLTGDRIGEGAGPYLTVPVVSAALLAGQEILSFPHRPLWGQSGQRRGGKVIRWRGSGEGKVGKAPGLTCADTELGLAPPPHPLGWPPIYACISNACILTHCARHPPSSQCAAPSYIGPDVAAAQKRAVARSLKAHSGHLDRTECPVKRGAAGHRSIIGHLVIWGSSLGCPKKTKSPNFVSQRNPLVFIG